MYVWAISLVGDVYALLCICFLQGRYGHKIHGKSRILEPTKRDSRWLLRALATGTLTTTTIGSATNKMKLSTPCLSRSLSVCAARPKPTKSESTHRRCRADHG